jgi:hypothetical protein
MNQIYIIVGWFMVIGWFRPKFGLYELKVQNFVDCATFFLMKLKPKLRPDYYPFLSKFKFFNSVSTSFKKIAT